MYLYIFFNVVKRNLKKLRPPDFDFGPNLLPYLINFLSNLQRAYENAFKKSTLIDASDCTHVTHRCHHAAHAYTGIPCIHKSKFLKTCLDLSHLVRNCSNLLFTFLDIY